jgi:hypothetical protein
LIFTVDDLPRKSKSSVSFSSSLIWYIHTHCRYERHINLKEWLSVWYVGSCGYTFFWARARSSPDRT